MKHFGRLALLGALLTLTTLKSGAQEKIIINSPNLKCNDTILVFSPEAASAQTPTLFLLHGWSGDWSNWSTKYDLQEISNRTGFRIITPDGFYNSWYLNNIDPAKMQYRTFVDEELYPQMKERYNLKRETTFITGLSMGGHGAINIFLDDTTRFRTAGSMSGVLDLPSTNLRKSQMSIVIGMDSLYCLSQSAHTRVAERGKGLSTPLVVTSGYDDFYATNAETFCKVCKENNIPYILMLSPGKHSWKYWGFALEVHLQIFKAILEGKNLGF